MNKRTSFLNFALVAAVLGGLGAAVLSHPKGKHIKENLKDVSDDFIDAVDRALDKIHPSNSGKDEPADVSDFILSLYDELKGMHNAASQDIHPVHSVEQPVTAVSSQLHKIESKIETKLEEAQEDIGDTIAWFQKKGRSLAKRGFK